MRERLLAEGLLRESQADKIVQQAQQTIAEAVDFARSSPEPDPQTVCDGVFTEF